MSTHLDTSSDPDDGAEIVLGSSEFSCGVKQSRSVQQLIVAAVVLPDGTIDCSRWALFLRHPMHPKGSGSAARRQMQISSFNLAYDLGNIHIYDIL